MFILEKVERGVRGRFSKMCGVRVFHVPSVNETLNRPFGTGEPPTPATRFQGRLGREESGVPHS